jgi:hypothetical protein
VLFTQHIKIKVNSLDNEIYKNYEKTKERKPRILLFYFSCFRDKKSFFTTFTNS